MLIYTYLFLIKMYTFDYGKLIEIEHVLTIINLKFKTVSNVNTIYHICIHVI